jgi:hypothetical protein
MIRILKYQLRRKRLKFVHITKTAGTSIEEIGKANGINWGKFHKEYGFWHDIFSDKSSVLKNKYNWFMVVRNPFTRAISEYYFCCDKGNLTNDVNVFNEQLIQLLKTYQENKYKPYTGEPWWLSSSGHHFTEQYKYLDSLTKINVLKFENLEEDFNNLMKKYNLNIRLNKHENKAKVNNPFTVSDLNNETKQLIVEIYKKDFETFGYSENSLMK